MPEPVAAPVAPAPSAPQPAAAPQQPQAPRRLRLSEMDQGLEAANMRMETRAPEPQLQQPPAQLPVEPAEGDSEPQEPAEGEQELAPPEGQPDAQTAADQELFEKFKAWKETGEMPEEFWSMPVEYEDKNGNLVRETFQGLKDRGMRLSDYHREMGVTRQQQQEMQVVRTNINQHFEQIRDPERFLEEYEDRGYGDTLEKVALKIAQRKTQDKQIAEAAGYRIMQQHNLPANHPDVVGAVRSTMQQLQHNRALEAELRRTKRQNEQLSQVRQQHDRQAGVQQRLGELNNSLRQLMPRAFQTAGIPNIPANEEAFMRHLHAYVTTQPNWDGNIRRKDAQLAAQMLREELDDFDNRRRAQKPAVQKPKALPPGRMGQAGSAQPSTPQRKRLSEMAGDDRFGFGLG